MSQSKHTQKLSEYAKEINNVGRSIGVDVRLEVLLAELLKGGLDPLRDVMIYPQGLFSRDYRPDVGVGTEKSGVWAGMAHDFDDEKANPELTDYREYLNIPVFRDGLYDYLPEGLFHQPTVDDEREFGKEIDEQARRERAARRFFRPIEQEFYSLGLLLELEERKYLITEENLGRHDQGEVLRGIWGLPADRLVQVPRQRKKKRFSTYRSMPIHWSVQGPSQAGPAWTTERATLLDIRQLNNLLYLLPVAHRLVNDRALVEQVLSLMLGVTVKLRTIPPMLMLIEVTDEDRIGPTELGQIEMGNFSLEGVYQDTMPGIEIRLGPLNEAQLTDFLPEGRSRAVLDLLIGYFLPAETEVVTQLLTDEDNRFLTLAKTGSNPTSVLGWASYI